MSYLFVHGILDSSLANKPKIKAILPNSKQIFVSYDPNLQSSISTCQLQQSSENTILAFAVRITAAELTKLDQRKGVYAPDLVPKFARIPIKIVIKTEKKKKKSKNIYTKVDAWTYICCDFRVNDKGIPRAFSISEPSQDYLDRIRNRSSKN